MGAANSLSSPQVFAAELQKAIDALYLGEMNHQETVDGLGSQRVIEAVAALI
jgi:hypothetical protein